MFPDPGARQPAPGRLRLVQAFVNTADIENCRDELETPAGLALVLRRIGVLAEDGNALGETDLAHAVAFREALRELLLANNGGSVSAEAVGVFERVARAAHLTLRFAPDGTSVELVPEAPGLDGALGLIAAVVMSSTADGSWPRLKACRRDVCHWVYYDQSRNHSSTWCSMLVCGNRTKSRTYRQRSRRS